MDQQKLRTLVFEKTGVKVDVDDPIFALVALNEAVLAEAVERHVARIDAASGQLAQQLAQHGRGSAGLPATVSGFEPATGVSPPVVPTPSAGTGIGVAPQERRLIGIALGAACVGALLVLAGQALLFRPAPPAPVTVPAPLTSEQIAAIATGEKFNRVVPRLDAKTRAAVQAEMLKADR